MKTKRLKKKPGELLAAIRTFVGYLEGTEKSEHTIKNYRLDLEAFRDFLGTPSLLNLRAADIERYQEHLKAQGLKTNTRRRKLLTLGKFLKFTSERHRSMASVFHKIPAPQKVERVPHTLSRAALLTAIRGLPVASVIEARNRALLWTLAETGCQVSEATRLRFSDFASGKLRIGDRTVPISADLARELERVQSKAGKSGEAPAFVGHNRYGSLGGAISSRGIELLVRSHAERLGSPKLTPRMFRHSVVVHWLKEGRSKTEIRELLGLKTEYAFRVYEPLIKSTT
jgi:integrase/recombinase XerD